MRIASLDPMGLLFDPGKQTVFCRDGCRSPSLMAGVAQCRTWAVRSIFQSLLPENC